MGNGGVGASVGGGRPGLHSACKPMYVSALGPARGGMDWSKSANVAAGNGRRFESYGALTTGSTRAGRRV